MDFTEYRQRGKEMVDYIADYLENIRDRRVFPDVKPGYMKNLLPDSAPLEGEQWDAIFGDVERVIMPGITHWQSPHMHAYFPALNSFPSLLGDMLADAINCLGFTWASSPACTELEIIVMNWLGKMINLPDDFLHLSSASRGGGVVQTTASEATLVCLLAGRTKAIQRFHEKRPGYQDAEINARLVAYCSDQAHSSVEKAALIGLVRMRYIEADENLSMRGQLLREAIEDDIRQGLVPFWVCATLGTTGSCSFDNLDEIGVVCREFNLWLHVDAAYAGSAFICPEFRTWLKGIERADSIAFNPSKWLMIHFDATALWVKDSTAVHRTFNVEPLYLQHENSGVAVDFMHWQIPLSRRFRALKIWFVLRSFGIKGLQRHIREGVRLAQKFEALVLADHRFEIPAKRHLGLVVFRIKGENEITERLLKRLNHRGNLHCIPSSLKGKYVIRFTVTSTRTTVDDILRDWLEIKNAATAILDEMNITISNRVYLKDTKEKCEGFGSSLLLSNSPLSPKIVNGSFAALFDADEFLAKTYAGIRIAHQESPSMRRRVRGILMSGKQFSLDSHMDVVVQTSMNSHTTNSKVVDCYGKTTGNVKNEERDAICEDEESLEDCEMNWILNTALQLNPTNYLAIINNQQITPIDIIHRQNNLALLTKYTTKYEVKNYTKSVNSVRTPLTQYQLYKSHRQPTVIKPNRNDNIAVQQTDLTNLYPGKRYLNLDLTLHNDSIFTDSIFNLPTPTEEVIPIIITADTPTTISKIIPEIEDLNKLRPPNSSFISIAETNNVLEDSNKPLPSSSILIPIVETADEVNDLSDTLPPKTIGISSLNKAEDLNKFQTSITTSFLNLKSSYEIPQVTIPYSTIFGATTTNTNPFIMQKSSTLVEESTEIIKDINNQTPTSSALVEIFSDFKELNSESNIQKPKYSIIADDSLVLKELNHEYNLPKSSTVIEKSLDLNELKELNNESNIQQSKYSDLVEDSSVFDLLGSESNIEPLRSSIVLEDSLDLKELNSKSNIPTLRSSTVVEYSIVFNELNNKVNNQPTNMSCDVEESSIPKQFNNESNVQPAIFSCDLEASLFFDDSNIEPLNSSAIVKDSSDIKELSRQSNIVPLSKSSAGFADFSVFKELNNESNIKAAKSSSEVEDSIICNKLNNESSIQTTKSSLVEDCTVFKELNREDNIQTSTSSIANDELSREGNFQQKTSTTAEDFSVFQNLSKDNHNVTKIFNSKSGDDSSSSDEFLESVGQPSNDSEGSSSATSSLELM